MGDFNFLLTGILSFSGFILFIILFLASRYRRCASNQVLAIYGKVGAGKSVKCFHGGGAFVWPLIQDYSYINLTPITINIPLKNALSQQNIRINVPSTFTIAISTDPETMNNAAVRLLELDIQDIEKMAMEIIFGQLRLTVASLTIEDINQDREKFLRAIRNNIEPELKKIGLTLINVNITDITDESDYIESIGKKAAAIAVNQAKIDVAEESKKGDVGSAAADKERRIQVSKYNAEAVQGENTAKSKIAEYNADLAEKEAQATQRGEVANQVSIAEIQKSKAHAEENRLEAEEIVQKEIDKRKIEIQANAEAERQRVLAQGEADAILKLKEAEAEGIQKVLDAKSSGYQKLVESCNSNPKEAATMLMVEKLEEIVAMQAEAIKNIKIDKVTVWDSGNAEKGSSTASFLSSMVKSLPALHDVARMAGVELPEYLGKTSTGQQEKKEIITQPTPVAEASSKTVEKSIKAPEKTEEQSK